MYMCTYIYYGRWQKSAFWGISYVIQGISYVDFSSQHDMSYQCDDLCFHILLLSHRAWTTERISKYFLWGGNYENYKLFSIIEVPWIICLIDEKVQNWHVYILPLTILNNPPVFPFLKCKLFVIKILLSKTKLG